MIKEEEIRQYVLDNAISYDGKADLNAVIGHLIAKHPEVKKDMKKFISDLKKTVEKINSMSLDKQKLPQFVMQLANFYDCKYV